MTILTKSASITLYQTRPFALKYLAVLLYALSLVILINQPVLSQDDERAKDTIEMDPMIYTLVRNGRPNAQVTVRVGIQIEDGVDFQSINNRAPQMRSDFLSLIASLSTQRFRLGKPIDPELLSSYFQMAAERRVGAKKVTIYVLEAGIAPF